MLAVKVVRREKFREVALAKISDAKFLVHDLRESERPVFNPQLHSAQIIGRLLPAARGVFQAAEARMDTKGAFSGWYNDVWLKSLSAQETDLWKTLTHNRDGQIHGEGPELTSTNLEVTEGMDPMSQSHVMQRVERPRAWKPVARFAAYPDRAASDVCNDWLALAQRFVDDFVRAFPVP
jgi:hypothetical protein